MTVLRFMFFSTGAGAYAMWAAIADGREAVALGVCSFTWVAAAMPGLAARCIGPGLRITQARIDRVKAELEVSR